MTTTHEAPQAPQPPEAPKNTNTPEQEFAEYVVPHLRQEADAESRLIVNGAQVDPVVAAITAEPNRIAVEQAIDTTRPETHAQRSI